MSELADIAARTQRFNEAARAFTPASPKRHAKLMPLKDGIIELRQKGASLRMIRELLATVDVAVSRDTIARFLADVNADAPPLRAGQRTKLRRAPVLRTHQQRTEVVLTANEAPPPRQPSATGAPAEAPTTRPRTRGPRIADPRDL